MMGRVIAYLDFARGIPLVILDPVGPTIDNFLDKVTRLPQAYQERLWRRVLYVDMSGRGERVVGWPLYYRQGTESLYAMSQRYLDVVRRIDPALQSASVEGFNALWRIGTSTGMILSALGLQITEAEHLLSQPHLWVERVRSALPDCPELEPAARFFIDEYAAWKEERQTSRSDSFRTKAALFTLDPTMRAMFGANRPSIDWGQVVEQRQAVLLDFRHEHDIERRRFKMMWVYSSLMDFIKQRGAGRHRPISFIIDELAALANFRASSGASLFADELEELINVFARNCMVWLTIAHQEQYQFDERIQKTLMTMGTHVFGVTSDTDAALSFARSFFRYDPFKVKRLEPMYMTSSGEAVVIDERPIEYTIEEQNLLNSYIFRGLPTFHFLVRPAPGEGNITGRLRHVSIANVDRNVWVNEELVARARSLLSARVGERKDNLLAVIDRRVPASNRSTMKGYGSPHRLPVPEDDDDAILREVKTATAQARRY
jgi:hypothetical protein